MLRIRPFVMGHLIGAVMTGAIAGAFVSPRFAFIAALALLGGAIVSCFICQWRPGVDAAAWKLWAVSVIANPVLLAALVFMARDWQCVLGMRRGWDCFSPAMAIIAACLCLLPPLGGLLWRWCKGRLAKAA
jgi:hypothetical protein